MITLTNDEKDWILLCKLHLTEKYPSKGYWHETAKPLFTEKYGWSPDKDNNYHSYLYCLFSRLLDLYLKIKDEWSDANGQLKSIFTATFEKRLSNDSDLPIERAIHSLCSLIQGNRITNEDGTIRYELSKD